MNRSVLVVDEHRVVAEGIAAILRDLNWTADVAFSGADLLRALKTKPYDAAIVDVNLPDMGWFAALDAVRLAGVRSKVILMSADSDDELIRLAINRGAVGFLSKTMAAEDLAAAMETVSAGSSYLPRAIRPTRPCCDAERLTWRQLQIVELLSQGLRARQIAEHLGLSVRTVECHKFAVMQICGTTSFLNALQVLRGHGILSGSRRRA